MASAPHFTAAANDVTIPRIIRHQCNEGLKGFDSGVSEVQIRNMGFDVGQNLGIARRFKPMSSQEMQALRERCRPSSGDGHLELFKTTKKIRRKRWARAAWLAHPQNRQNCANTAPKSCF
jgi:hypothetical protein